MSLDLSKKKEQCYISRKITSKILQE